MFSGRLIMKFKLKDSVIVLAKGNKFNKDIFAEIIEINENYIVKPIEFEADSFGVEEQYLTIIPKILFGHIKRV